MRALAGMLVALLFAHGVAAQEKTTRREGVRPPLERGREIALARSAAPPAVSAGATVWILTSQGYQVAERGTNGAACYVSRSWLHSVEPHCFDAEGAASILPMEMRRVEMYQRGASHEEVRKAIAESLDRGEFRLPRRPAVSYMMSSSQVLYDDDGTYVGQWRSHLMIFMPFMTNEDIGMGEAPDIRAAMVNDSGRPEANLMVILKDFIDPAPAKRP
jgi:hypothetical protein